MDRDRLFLQDMLHHAKEIQEFTAGGETAFRSERKTQVAVIHNFMVIGEAAKQVSEETKASLDLPWRRLAGFRDRLIHAYMHVDLDVVWNAVSVDVAPIVRVLEARTIS